jgi:hypothetical protein
MPNNIRIFCEGQEGFKWHGAFEVQYVVRQGRLVAMINYEAKWAVDFSVAGGRKTLTFLPTVRCVSAYVKLLTRLAAVVGLLAFAAVFGPFSNRIQRDGAGIAPSAVLRLLWTPNWIWTNRSPRVRA